MSNVRTDLKEDVWAQLQPVLEAFASAWDEDPSPPVLLEFADTGISPVPHQLITELIKIDLEQRWQRGLRRLLEDYRTEIVDLDRYITGQLIFEEYHVRRKAGDDVRPDEYFDRFPQHVADLRHLFGLELNKQSTHSPGSSDTTEVATEALQPGQSIDDFDLLLQLGEGAFATVFLARQRSMQRLVAVKVSEHSGAEPQTLAQLDHNNIVRVYDQRVLEDLGLRLLYMQYLPGGTLDGVIEKLQAIPSTDWNGRAYLKVIDETLDLRGETVPGESTVRRRLQSMTWPQVVAWIGEQLARALDAAGKHGVLHRDLKPANVLLTAEGVPKLADFNTSFGENVEGTTAFDSFGGTMAYMSPEQMEVFDLARSRPADSLDGRSDQYSLAVLLWELQTGDRPFDDSHASRRNPFRSMIEHRRQGVSQQRAQMKLDADASAVMDVLERCLAADPEHRFPSAIQLAGEFEICLQPAARRLMSGGNRGLSRWVRRFPLITVTMITVIPNIVAAVFNFIYNHGQIVAQLPRAEPVFMRTQAIINLIAFPTGMICAGWLAGSVARAVKVTGPGEMTETDWLDRRLRCLELGNLAAIVGLTLWLVAAPAYPISLHLMLGSVPAAVYAHFVASLTLCGLIAAAYPFFGVTYVSLRCFYPNLLKFDSVVPSRDLAAVRRLSRLSWLYLSLAASVPMIAVLVLVITGSNDRFELITLAAGGVLGFGIAVTAFRTVQADLETLSWMLSRD